MKRNRLHQIPTQFTQEIEFPNLSSNCRVSKAEEYIKTQLKSTSHCINKVLEIILLLTRVVENWKIPTVNGESERRYAKVFDVELERSIGSSPSARRRSNRRASKTKKKLFFSFAQRASTSRRERDKVDIKSICTVV